MASIKEYADNYVAAKAAKAKAEENLKEANALVAEAERLLYQKMIEEETLSIRTDNGTFTATVTPRITAKKGLKEELIRQLRAHDLGDIVKEDVNANTLNATAKEVIAQNGGAVPEWLGEVANIFMQQGVSLRH